MKYKFNKLQGGGAMVATYTPIERSVGTAPVGSGATPTKEIKTSEEETLLDKDIYKKLIEQGGLVNDVNAFIEKVIELESSPFAYLNKNNSSKALQLIAEVNRIKQNKELWQDTYKNAQALGGFGEVAVGKQGELFVKDKDSFKAVSLLEYSKNRDKYNPLTVSELLRARRLDPNLVNNDAIFQVGETAYGTNGILKKVEDIIKIVSEDTFKTERHYSKDTLEKQLGALKAERVPTEEQKNSIAKLQSMLSTPGEQYKVVDSSKSKDRYKQVAYDYLLSSLTQEEKNKLKAVAAINGTNINDLLERSLTLGLSGEEKIYEISPEKVGAGESESEKGLTSLNTFQLFHKDKLASPNLTFAFNDPKYSVLFKGAIGGVSPLVTPEGDSIGITTLGNVLKSGYNQIVKSDKIFFGNKQVDPTSLNSVIYNGEEAAKVYIPTDGEGKPDYESFQEFKELYTVYEANKDKWSAKEAENFFYKNGYKLEIEEVYEGGKREKIIKEGANVKPFLLMYGYTNDATGLTEDNDLLTKLTDEEETNIVPVLNTVWTVGSGKERKNLTPNKSWNIEDYYKGMIAIPYKDNAAAIVDAMVGHGPREKMASIADVQRNIRYSSNQPLNPSTSSALVK